MSMKEIENSFGGNICRCTGYRPILDAFKSLAHDADEKLLAVCKDIEDLDKTCPKTGSPCVGKCQVAEIAIKKPLHMFFAENKEWHKVSTVKDIFTIFDNLGSKPYMLVAGNTAHGNKSSGVIPKIK
jgi:xanthine dehydrogenase/oxidase